MYSTTLKSSLLIAVLIITGLILPKNSEAHCDSMDGPVVLAAQEALETGNVNLALIWVNEEQEAQIRLIVLRVTVLQPGFGTQLLALSLFYN